MSNKPDIVDTATSSTVLILTPLFSPPEFFKNQQCNFCGAPCEALSFKVTRRFCDATGFICPTTSRVHSNLTIQVKNTVNEDPTGTRFLIKAIASQPLQMDHGPICKFRKPDKDQYAEDTIGIQSGAELELFVDLSTNKGAVISYTIPASKTLVRLQEPDDIHFSVNPSSTVPYELRPIFDEEDRILKKLKSTPPTPADAGTNGGSPAPASDS